MQNSNRCVDPTVQAFLTLVSQADAVMPLDAPVLSSWDASDAVGDPDNQVLAFRWEDQSGIYGFQLTEGGISSGRWHASAFLCSDCDGNEVQLTLIRHVPITPTMLRKPENSGDAQLVNAGKACECPRLYTGY